MKKLWDHFTENNCKRLTRISSELIALSVDVVMKFLSTVLATQINSILGYLKKMFNKVVQIYDWMIYHKDTLEQLKWSTLFYTIYTFLHFRTLSILSILSILSTLFYTFLHFLHFSTLLNYLHFSTLFYTFLHFLHFSTLASNRVLLFNKYLRRKMSTYIVKKQDNWIIMC